MIRIFGALINIVTPSPITKVALFKFSVSCNNVNGLDSRQNLLNVSFITGTIVRGNYVVAGRIDITVVCFICTLVNVSTQLVVVSIAFVIAYD